MPADAPLSALDAIYQRRATRAYTKERVPRPSIRIVVLPAPTARDATLTATTAPSR